VSQQFLPIPRQPLYLPAWLLPRFDFLPPMVILRRLVHRGLMAALSWAMVLDFARLACSKVFFGSDTNVGTRTHTRTNTHTRARTHTSHNHAQIYSRDRKKSAMCVCVCARAFPSILGLARLHRSVYHFCFYLRITSRTFGPLIFGEECTKSFGEEATWDPVSLRWRDTRQVNRACKMDRET
jgi:hypothetical protein